MYAHRVFVPWLLGGALWALSPQPPATRAVSSTEGLSVVWQAEGPCASAEQLRANLARILPHSAGEAPRGTLHARLVPLDDEVELDRWSMEITVTSAAGSWRRRIDDQRCADMVAVATFIAAIALNPLDAGQSLAIRAPRGRPQVEGAAADDGVAATSPVVEVGVAHTDASAARPAASGAASPAAEAPESSEVRAAPAADRRERAGRRPTGGLGESGQGLALASESTSKAPRGGSFGASARVATHGSLGPLPGIGALLLGGLGLTIDHRALVELAAIHRFEARSTAVVAPGVTLSSRMSGGRLSGCWTPRFAAIELPLCAGLELAALRVEALGLLRSTPSTRAQASGLAGARLLWRPAPWVGVGLDVGASVMFGRHSYRLDELPETVITTALLGGHVGLSLELRAL